MPKIEQKEQIEQKLPGEKLKSQKIKLRSEHFQWRNQ